ncbi:MAG TPA: hypothetical protein VK522_04990 [Pseudolabrys sp.]|jgi:hypothetical protein|nr:hypothetical protein [Pseudolabrys sp.]
MMRRIIPALSIAAVAAAALITPASAEIDGVNPNYAPAVVAGGALVGTAVGVGLYQGWYGSSAFVTAGGATAGTAAALGGVAGVGTIALLEGVTAKCHGFGVLWTARSECVNGQWVGDGPRRRVSMR